MDIMTIIYIVVAFVVGAILTSIFKKGSNSTSSDNAKMQELEAENGSLKEKLSSISNESRNKESQLKEKYESLLSEAQKQCDSLDKQLKSAIDGNIDESIKKQLEQVEKLALSKRRSFSTMHSTNGHRQNVRVGLMARLQLLLWVSSLLVKHQ